MNTHERRLSMTPFRLLRWKLTSCCGHNWGHALEPPGASRRVFLKTAVAGAASFAAMSALKKTADA
jgi:hypothetical protein